MLVKSLNMSAITHTVTWNFDAISTEFAVINATVLSSLATFTQTNFSSGIFATGTSLDVNGASLQCMVELTGLLLSDVITSKRIIIGGTVDANGFNLEVTGGDGTFDLDVQGGATTMGSGTWTFKAVNIRTNFPNPAPTINGGTSTLIVDGPFNTHGQSFTFHDLQVPVGQNLSFLGSGSLSFHDFTIGAGTTLTLVGGKTTTASGTFSSNGVLGTQAVITSSSTSTISSPSASVSYTDVYNNTAAGAGVPFDDSVGGFDGGGNTNWTFSASPIPVADFTGTPLTGDAPFNVQFTDTSTNNPTSWLWDFFGDGSVTSTLQNPSFTYYTAGTFTVKMTATNAFGSNTKTQIAYITSGDANLYLQNIFMIGSDDIGLVQLVNVGKNDNSAPIFYELQTQELEFGNRLHLKKIADKIVAFTHFGSTSQLQAKTDEGDWEKIPMNLSSRVNIGTNINLEGHFVTFKWFGESSEETPVFEGLYLEDITDLGMVNS